MKPRLLRAKVIGMALDIGRSRELSYRYVRAYSLLGSVLTDDTLTDEERGKIATEIYKTIETEARAADHGW